MEITTIGLDLAKNVFQVHGVDRRGNVVLKKQLKRNQVLSFFANLQSCRIGMEACASAHYWGRRLLGLGHDVKLMAPQFVKPYVKTNKNDARDAEAICEAVSRPNMRFVALKTPAQQAVLSIHRARQGFVKARTAQVNQIRGLLGEFGIVMPQGIRQLPTHLPDILEDAENELPGAMRALVHRLWENFQVLDRQVGELEREIKRLVREDEAVQRLTEIPGIGPITASALAATVGDARAFTNARQMAAWLGLVPRQHSSGGKESLGGISKRGDCYLRSLLVHGARAVVKHAERKNDDQSHWIKKLLARRHDNVATVAVANKNARIAWAILAHGRHFESLHQPRKGEHGLPTGVRQPA
jgi:transposase